MKDKYEHNNYTLLDLKGLNDQKKKKKKHLPATEEVKLKSKGKK